MRQAWLLFPFLQMIKLRLMLSKLVSFTKCSFHNNSYLGKHIPEHFLSTFWHNTCCGLLPPGPRTFFSLLFRRSVVSDSLRPHGLQSGSSVHGILQGIVLEWVAISFSRGTSRPKDRTQVSRLVGRRFNLWATREVQLNVKLLFLTQSPTSLAIIFLPCSILLD